MIRPFATAVQILHRAPSTRGGQAVYRPTPPTHSFPSSSSPERRIITGGSHLFHSLPRSRSSHRDSEWPTTPSRLVPHRCIIDPRALKCVFSPWPILHIVQHTPKTILPSHTLFATRTDSLSPSFPIYNQLGLWTSRYESIPYDFLRPPNDTTITAANMHMHSTVHLSISLSLSHNLSLPPF